MRHVDLVGPMISVNLIRAFRGPRHTALEDIWDTFARTHKDRITLHIFENRDGRVPHDMALAAMWAEEKRRREPRVIFTEFDFLPTSSLAQWPDGWSLQYPIRAAEYVTRDPETLQLRSRGIPGAWFVRIQKDLLRETPNFWAGGPFHDPANQLQDALLYPQEDCLPNHFGTKTRGAGQHLFWSRHYNDLPETMVAGFKLGPILAGVDRAIAEWHPWVPRSA